MFSDSFQRKYVAEFVYGGIDGVVTTFAVISGALGASLSPGIVIIFGFANLFADGFSMAVSNYLSEKSERSLAWGKGDAKDPRKTAAVTFTSFVVIGVLPVVPFVLAVFLPALQDGAFILSGVLTALAFMFVGIGKSFVTHKKPFFGALETLVLGGVVAAIAFTVGYFLQGLAA